MENYVVFHNAADDSYMNKASNFRGAYAATQTVDVYFASATTAGGYDKIVVACTNGEEDRAIEQLAGAMSGSKAGGMTVVADDVNSVYACQDIISVTSITLSATGNVIPTIDGKQDGSNADIGGTAHSMVFANKHSGSIVNVSATTATSTITLPTSPINGFNLRFVAAADNSAHTNTIAGAFYGVTLQAGDTVEHDLGSTSAVIAASDFKKGDHFEIVYTGAAYHIRGMFDTAASIAVS